VPRCTVISACIDQPTMRRENRSRTAADVKPSFGRPDIGEVGDPLAVRPLCGERPVGAVSVFKAVYVDRRELKCACVGGDSNVPLGFISLTENLMMVAMAIWMLLK
jgi:hypothetical protein